MRTVFLTTRTTDCFNHVASWNAISDVPAVHLTFDHHGVRNDGWMVEQIERIRPELTVYIGAHEAPGNPWPEAFRAMRRVAPLVNLVSDATDRPWHKVIRTYRAEECFDLQVSIDGEQKVVDYATLTPVDQKWFEGFPLPRNVRCGFSGSVGHLNVRSEIIKPLMWFGGLAIRKRAEADDYPEHAAFLRRCRMVLNVSNTGSGRAHHIKGRVLEAGWAGCCLLESEGSPIADWFPEGCWIGYRDVPHAAELIRDLDDETIAATAARLSMSVRTRYTPEAIWGGILKRLGLVADPVAVSAA